MKKRRWDVRNDRMLSEEQLSHLIKHLEDRRDLAIGRGNDDAAIRDYYIVRALLESGLRVSELCDLNLSDVQGGKVTVRHGKGDLARTVLLTPAGARLFREWMTVRERLGCRMHPDAKLFESRLGERYTRQGVAKRVRAAFQACGLPSALTTHSLRHTNCSRLLKAGVPITVVRDNLGHHSIAVTNLYAHSSGSLDKFPDIFTELQNTGFSQPEAPQKKLSKRNLVREFVRKGNSK